MKPAALLFGLTLGLLGSGLPAPASALTLQTAKVYTAPGADVTHAAPLPGGRWAVSADNAVMVLDAGLRVQRAWHTLQGPVVALAVSPDGARIAAMTRSRWTVWAADTGERLDSGEAFSSSLGFGADGTLLVMYRGGLLSNALGTDPARFRAIDVGTGWEDFVASPDGQTAVLGNADLVRLVRLEDQQVLAEAELSGDGSGLGATFSPDGQSVVVRTGAEGLLLRAGEDVVELDGGEDMDVRSGSVYFPSEREFVYASFGEGQRYDAQTGEALGDTLALSTFGPVARGKGGPGDSAPFLALGRGVARFDPVKRTEQGRVGLPSGNTWLGAFLSDGRPLAGVDEFVNLGTGQAQKVGALDDLYDYDAQAGAIWTLNGTAVSVYRGGKVSTLATLDEDAGYDTLVASPDGSLAVASGYDGLAVLSARTGKVVKKLTSKALKVEDIHGAALSPDGRSLLVVPHEGHVLRVDLGSGKQTTAFRLPSGDEVLSVQVGAGGTLAAISSDDDSVSSLSLIRPGSATPFKTVALDGRVRQVRFSPDGKLIALLTDASENALQVYDAASGARLAQTGRFNTTTSLLAWAPGGKQLMVGAGLLGQAGSTTIFNVLR
ncbi:WD40 repeat domain-containing protein [Deinococcus koreensis]|uniref:Anaphase-promoting complex subunit 4 WD40 domain-containing protein n=1 Tax=Deinococcus koreensis TaxID=2054903 RepID=A0A2K3UZS6_9DEIO|nr:WD40 repeat domain-containing protein [Deinococcus koreensis]PNY82033.1 hypothetical protein CVO96_12230 [Deinococcus koreensis]